MRLSDPWLELPGLGNISMTCLHSRPSGSAEVGVLAGILFKGALCLVI